MLTNKKAQEVPSIKRHAKYIW